MPSLNKCMIIGNVGSEPEMRFTGSGIAVTNFSVAVNDKIDDVERTEWFKVVAWKKLAETCNQYLAKGRQVYVEGRTQTQSWEDQEGQTHYKQELIANRVIFLGKKEATQESEEPESNEIKPEDLPFG